MFNQLQNDYKLHGSTVCYPSFWAICNYRIGRWALTVRFQPLRWFFSKVYGLTSFLILITSCIEVHREATIGKDFRLIHPAGNIHIHPGVVIGDRCGICNDVTIGTNSIAGVSIRMATQSVAPNIGNDVYIAAGAKVLGGITIGDGVIIAANSLVTVNVPKGHMAIGVPAKITKLARLKSASVENIQEGIASV